MTESPKKLKGLEQDFNGLRINRDGTTTKVQITGTKRGELTSVVALDVFGHPESKLPTSKDE